MNDFYFSCFRLNMSSQDVSKVLGFGSVLTRTNLSTVVITQSKQKKIESDISNLMHWGYFMTY
jgi:hypothetical protein